MTFNRLLDLRPADWLARMTDADRAALGEEILRRPPSPEGWQALLELFALWPENEAKARSLDLAEQRLAGWDDSLRRVDSSRGFLYQGQELSSLARLVREFEIDRREERGTTELVAIANSGNAASLRSLSISRSEVGRRAWQALAQSRCLPELRRFHVRKTVLGNDELAVLFRSPWFTHLQSLALVDTGFAPGRLHGVPASFSFHDLQEADFSDNALGDEGAGTLTSLPWLGGVRVLRLQQNFLTTAGVHKILASPVCRGLALLDLTKNQVLAADQPALLDLAAKQNVRLLV